MNAPPSTPDLTHSPAADGLAPHAALEAAWRVFCAGFASRLTLAGRGTSVGAPLDAVPLLVCDLAGRVLRRTPALDALLAADADGHPLRAALLAVVEAAGAPASGRPPPPGHPPVAGSVRTPAGTFHLRGCSVPEGVFGDAPAVLVQIEPADPPAVAAAALRERFGLTSRQAEVALLLAERQTNREIAETLGISPHTAERHTERVLHKLDVGSRTEVRARFAAATGPG